MAIAQERGGWYTCHHITQLEPGAMCLQVHKSKKVRDWEGELQVMSAHIFLESSQITPDNRRENKAASLKLSTGHQQ